MSKPKHDPAIMTQDDLKRALNYDPESGVFTWLLREDCSNRFNGKWAGKKAGSLRRDGRVFIFMSGKMFAAHRLAWLYVYGEWPVNSIDHINGDPSDNRIENLRDVSHTGNTQNLRGPKRNNVSGYLGVVFDKRWGKFDARIATNGKRTSLGRFDTAEEASEAYLAAKRALHSTCSI